MTVAKHFEVQAIDGVECFHLILRYLVYVFEIGTNLYKKRKFSFSGHIVVFEDLKKYMNKNELKLDTRPK